MLADSLSNLDGDLVVAWIAATHGIVVPRPIADVAAIELGHAARHALAVMKDDLPAGDPIDFLDVLEAYAEIGA